jgi:tetratricopeptide (TPR) repeat protein
MKRIAQLLAALIAVVPGAALAQSWGELWTLTFAPVGPERSATERATTVPAGALEPAEEDPSLVIARIQAAAGAIESERARNGENSIGLVPLFESLARIYLEIGGYRDAIAALEQAQQIIRRHQGLYALDQAELIEQIIETEMSLSPSAQSIERESYLRELVRRNPTDPRNVEILTKMAGRQMDVVRHAIVNGVPPEFTLNVGIGFAPGPSSISARSLAASMLRRSRSNYRAAIRASIAHGEAEISQLLEIEDSIIDSYYFELVNPQLRGGRIYWGTAGLYSGGINALHARLKNVSQYSRSPEAISRALIEMADWHLMFRAFGRAMDVYALALANLREQGVAEERVAAMFSPEAPVPLPADPSVANVYEALSDVRGYFDVEVEINRFGGVRDVRVTGRSGSATDDIERRFRTFVAQSRFRPRYVDGEWLSSDRFPLRYEFGYSSL